MTIFLRNNLNTVMYQIYSLVVVEVIFTALHGMQTRSSDENSVRLSVPLSNA